MKKLSSGIMLILVVAFVMGLTRTGAFTTLTDSIDSLNSEGFNALRGV